MKSLFSIGSKQTDLEIFKYINDSDIKNICLINKYANSLLNEEKYWIHRFFYIYGKHIGTLDIKKFKLKKSWKQYYIDVTTQIKNPFPYYSIAIAISSNRIDIFEILRNMVKIKPVKGVLKRKGEMIECYYTRDGTVEGIKEGPYFKVRLPKKNNNHELSYEVISIFPDRLEEFYNEGIIQSSSEFINNIKVSEKIFQQEELIRSIEWNKKGVKIHEEIIDESITYINKWFVNGSIRSKSEYVNGKKNGIWYRWNKTGDETKKFYSEGKRVNYIPTLEEIREDFEYFKEIQEEVKKFRSLSYS